MKPEYTNLTKDTEAVPIPAAAPIILVGKDCLTSCDEKCANDIHICDSNSCPLYCKEKRLISQGKFVKETDPLLIEKNILHDCAYGSCTFVCFYQDRPDLACGRLDQHKCLDGINCQKLCTKHHPVDHFGKAPGVISASFIPPRNQRFPILRVEIETNDGEKRLVSTLCKKCAEEKRNFSSYVQCHHTDEERKITGTFVLSEVAFAINIQGYTVAHISSILFYPRYNNNNFRPILELLAKTKIMASGWPSDDMTEDRKIDYVNHLQETTGFSDITLNEVQNHPALRNISKLLMNRQHYIYK